VTRRLPRPAATRTGILLTSALVFGASLRMTRFVTRDWLGEWTIAKPLKTWAIQHEADALTAQTEERKRIIAVQENLVQWELQQQITPDEQKRLDELRAETGMWDQYDEHYPISWQQKLAHGLDCPFCVGFWVGLIMLSATVLMPQALQKPWKVLLGALGLNYVVGHVSSRLDG
jgi:hypothetical protein